jgi:hypothetical protein
MPTTARPVAHASLLAALLTGALALPAQAAFVTNSTGLTLPHQTLDFEGQPLVMNQAVTNEFQAFGVTFTGGYGNPDPSTTYANISGNRIGNFQANGTCAPFNCVLTLDFTNVLSSVAFALVSAPGTSTIQAFLNGSLVESGSPATSANDLNNYYGFDGIQFDRVTLSVASFDRALMIDNLQTIDAPTAVPEPAGWALVGLALAGLGAFSRQRARPGQR